MSKEKQIEEMSTEIREAVNGCSSYWSGLIAGHLIEQGYRKQSEGEWVNKSEDRVEFYEYTYQCSLCGYCMIICAEEDVNFCPKCGAKMKQN